MQYINKSLVRLGICGVLISLSTPSRAQIVPDNTLGTEASRITPNALINGENADIIDLGARRDRNLFHSFSEFNISDGQRVYFANPSGVVNILTRVTGGSASNILGTLGVDGSANLFLINPNGILFGENARLDMGGSFLGTTANAVEFAEQGFFRAANPESPPLLTVNPSALFFNNQLDQGNITNRARLDGLNGETNFIGGPVGLQVANGKTLALIGGNILLDDGNLTAPGGHIEVASPMGTGSVKLTPTEAGFNFNYDGINNFGEIKLENTAVVDAIANGGGNVVFTAKDITIDDSTVLNGILGGTGSINTQAGDIRFDAKDTVNINNDSGIFNYLDSGAMGNLGNVQINARSLSINNGAQVGILNFGEGNTGDLIVRVAEEVQLNGGEEGKFGGLFVQLRENGKGSAGNILVETENLNILNGAAIGGRTFGEGNIGKIQINARNAVSLDNGVGNSSIFNIVSTTGVGDTGGININTGSLFIQNGAGIFANTFGKGNAGKIEITARETISLSGNSRSSIQNSVATSGIGNTEGININTGSLFLSDKAAISTNVNGRGNSGGVNIVARDLVSLDKAGEITRAGQAGTIILSRVNDEGEGNSGDINIKTGSLRASNSQITTSTSSKGNSGNVIIDAQDEVLLLRDTEIFTEVTCACETRSGKGGDGNAGDIRITTGSLVLGAGSNLRSDTEAKGDGGDIVINARERVTFEGRVEGFTSGAFSQVEPEGQGKGGDIFINARTLSLSDDQEINTRTQGQGDAGNIFINAESISLTGADVRITSGASQRGRLPGTLGNGGNINIDSKSLLVNNGARIFADSEFSDGIAGNLNINSDKIRLDNQASLSADTRSANTDIEQATIRLKTDALILRRNSRITTNATGENVIGGNININADVLAALEDSDISANSADFRGGRVQITSQAVFGTQTRDFPTPNSDITATGASPQLMGTTEINTPDIDPSQGTIELPNQAVDKSDQIGKVCPRGIDAAEKIGEFTITGRGNLPPSPLEPLTGSHNRRNLATLDGDMQTSTQVRQIDDEDKPMSQLVEAQGWVKNADGKIELVARLPQVVSGSWHNGSDCLK